MYFVCCFPGCSHGSLKPSMRGFVLSNAPPVAVCPVLFALLSGLFAIPTYCYLLQVCYLVNNLRHGVVEIFDQLFVKRLCWQARFGMRNSPDEVVLYGNDGSQQRVDVVFVGIFGVKRNGYALRKQFGTNVVHAFFQFSFIHIALNFKGCPAPLNIMVDAAKGPKGSSTNSKDNKKYDTKHYLEKKM